MKKANPPSPISASYSASMVFRIPGEVTVPIRAKAGKAKVSFQELRLQIFSFLFFCIFLNLI